MPGPVDPAFAWSLSSCQRPSRERNSFSRGSSHGEIRPLVAGVSFFGRRQDTKCRRRDARQRGRPIVLLPHREDYGLHHPPCYEGRVGPIYRLVRSRALRGCGLPIEGKEGDVYPLHVRLASREDPAVVEEFLEPGLVVLLVLEPKQGPDLLVESAVLGRR